MIKGKGKTKKRAKDEEVNGQGGKMGEKACAPAHAERTRCSALTSFQFFIVNFMLRFHAVDFSAHVMHFRIIS